MKGLITSIFVLATATFAFSQTKEHTHDENSDHAHQKEMRKTAPRSAEEQARIKTGKLAKQVDLSKEQQMKVYDVQLTLAKNNKAVIDNVSFTKEQKKSALNNNKEKSVEALSSILTDNQMLKLKEDEAEKNEQRSNFKSKQK
ncbi:MAG: hypothetical protein ACI9G9_001329 [Psychromonas sp.]|jgi:hypothetical protein